MACVRARVRLPGGAPPQLLALTAPPLAATPVVSLSLRVSLTVAFVLPCRFAGSPQKASAAGSDGGWYHSTALKTRYSSPTGLMSFDGESAWTQHDPHVLVPKEWGKQTENWKSSLREFAEPSGWTAGQPPSWKSVNYKRCALPTPPSRAPTLHLPNPRSLPGGRCIVCPNTIAPASRSICNMLCWPSSPPDARATRPTRC